MGALIFLGRLNAIEKKRQKEEERKREERVDRYIFPFA